MPIYEYACKKCDHTLDALQKIADAPLVDCPECGEAALKRLLSAPRFRLKGKGWYETDFKKDNRRNIAGDKEPVSSSKEKSSQDSSSKDKPASTKSGDKVKSESHSSSNSSTS